MTADAIMKFWTDAGRQRWFAKDERFDADLRRSFGDAHHVAACAGYAEWEQNPIGVLALLLLLDQMPRNIFRGSAHAFATDARALAVASRAIVAGFDRHVDPAIRCFLYLPLEHAENITDQNRSVALFEALGDAEFLRYAVLHREIIARFGRFPHRNAVMGRTSTPDEVAFLEAGGFAG